MILKANRKKLPWIHRRDRPKGENRPTKTQHFPMPRKSARQSSLFDETPAPATSAELLRIDQGEAALNPAQRAFNRLTKQIGEARAKLAQWEALAQHLHERSGREIQPGVDALAHLQRALIMQIDEMLTHTPAGLRLTPRRRAGLTRFLLARLDELLSEIEDGALTALHDHYSDISLEDRREIEESLERAFAERLSGEMFGDDDPDPTPETIEELYRRMDERMAAEQKEREAQASQRKRSRKESAAQARREEEAQGARLSVREIYRKLVSSLHPDREADPAERERKTTLMKEINRAYQANDLLSLLKLQMEVEQISAASLASLPAQRLAHYNEVLREQLRTLQAEIDECTQKLAYGLGGHPSFRLREAKDAELLFARQLRELRESQANYRALIEALANPKQRLAEIEAITRAMAES